MGYYYDDFGLCGHIDLAAQNQLGAPRFWGPGAAAPPPPPPRVGPGSSARSYTPYCFMRRFLKAAGSDKKLELLSFFLIELTASAVSKLMNTPI
ncbi:hypothetical protein ZWY2020_034134 [Hordeum vulgare]|nr:hypothetical protein ZWY2020_034134 [Hordeum vulgare]